MNFLLMNFKFKIKYLDFKFRLLIFYSTKLKSKFNFEESNCLSQRIRVEMLHIIFLISSNNNI